MTKDIRSDWWNTSAAERANRLIDEGRGKDMGCIVGTPIGMESDETTTWVLFGAVIVDGRTGVPIPVPTQNLTDAGIDPTDDNAFFLGRCSD